MIILCDIDSVLNDLLPVWLQAYNQEFGRSSKVEDITCWDTGACVPDGAKVFTILDRPGFFESLPVMPGAADGLHEMISQGHEVYLVSAGSNHALSEKSRWVRKHLPFMRDRVFFTDGKTPKGLIQGHVLIDDGPHNLIGFKARNPFAYAIAADYAYTKPAHDVCDLIVPFRPDPIDAWAQITTFTKEL